MPKLHAIRHYEAADNKILNKLILFGSPIGIGHWTAKPSEMSVEIDATEELKFTVTQASGAPAEYWKPGQICIDIHGVRALRDALQPVLRPLSR